MHSLSQQLIHEGIHGSGIVTGKTRLSPFRRVNGFCSANRATKVHTGAANWVMLGQARGVGGRYENGQVRRTVGGI